MSQITTNPNADRDVGEAAAYIAARNLSRGLRFCEATDRLFERRAEMLEANLNPPDES